MGKENITIEFTKRDKIYLSIIFCLIIVIVCLAICLPRPYKFIDKEVVVYQPQNIKVYDTKYHNLTTPTNPLYDQASGYYEDSSGNKYFLEIQERFINVGELEGVSASVLVNENGINVKKTILLADILVNLFVSGHNESCFGVEINLDYYDMQNVKNLFETNLGVGTISIKEDFLFEFKFKQAEINLIITFLSE